ncbi:hypothetical protein K2X33_16600 [bacterium]|nr:hypothetical protein [bacterium]
MRTLFAVLILNSFCVHAKADAVAASSGGPKHCAYTAVKGDGVTHQYRCTEAPSYSGGGRSRDMEVPSQTPFNPPTPEKIYHNPLPLSQQNDAIQALQDRQRVEQERQQAQSQEQIRQHWETFHRMEAEHRQKLAELDARMQQDFQTNLAVAHTMVRRGEAMAKGYGERADSVAKDSEKFKQNTDQAIKETQDSVLEQSKEALAILENTNNTPPEIAENAEGDSGVEVAERIGKEAHEEAENAKSEGDEETASLLETVAVLATDIGLGFVPGVGTSKDLIEAVSGKSILTGEDIGVVGRSFAALGVVSVGVAPAAAKSFRALGKIVTRLEGVEVAVGGGAGGAFYLAEEIYKSAQALKRYGPLDPGPLAMDEITRGVRAIDTFHASSYFANTLGTDLKLYRVFDGSEANELGRFWSRTQPAGRLQVQLDLALHPNFKNSATHWVEVTVPRGITIFEGKAASMGIPGGTLFGHGSQVIIRNQIPKEWITARGTLK